MIPKNFTWGGANPSQPITAQKCNYYPVTSVNGQKGGVIIELYRHVFYITGSGETCCEVLNDFSDPMSLNDLRLYIIENGVPAVFDDMNYNLIPASGYVVFKGQHSSVVGIIAKEDDIAIAYNNGGMSINTIIDTVTRLL